MYIQLLAGVTPRESCKSLFIENKILPLPALYIFKCLIFLKKYPQYFEHSKFNHYYNKITQNKYLFSLEKHKNVAYEKGLLYPAKSFYKEIRRQQSLILFKCIVKSYLYLNRLFIQLMIFLTKNV
jgi:hypothetical protein